jgi:hypothetical protein
MTAFDREVEVLEQQLEDGEITTAEFNSLTPRRYGGTAP